MNLYACACRKTLSARPGEVLECCVQSLAPRPCRHCHGPIYRPEVVPGHPSRYWLHLHAEDWQDNLHNAEPADG